MLFRSREEIERLLENITTLAEAAALASSTALTDELVSHGELMSTLLFVEILRERGIQAQWFDARKVLRTNDRFGRAEPDIAAVAEQVLGDGDGGDEQGVWHLLVEPTQDVGMRRGFQNF